MSIGSTKILQIGFSTAHAEAAARFYSDALGFYPVQDFELDGGAYGQLVGLPEGRFRLLRLQLGQECLELCEVLDPGPNQRSGRAIPTASRSCDLWFQHICLVTSDLDQSLQRLGPALGHGLAQPVSRAPQTLPDWNVAAAGIRAFKFRDPEGHNLELLQFPPDKGDARWHQGSGMLGIDHSAISIGDSSRSCRFYDDLLGLQLGGDGVNSGPTQDDLDGLQQTRVRITGHRCPTGPGIECLAYLDPNQGRPMPADLAIQDLAHWQIRLLVDDLAGIVDRIDAYGGQMLSDGVVDLGDQATVVGAPKGVQVADPDGHRLQLVGF